MLECAQHLNTILHVGFLANFLEQTAFRAVAADQEADVAHMLRFGDDAGHQIDALAIDEARHDDDGNCDGGESHI